MASGEEVVEVEINWVPKNTPIDFRRVRRINVDGILKGKEELEPLDKFCEQLISFQPPSSRDKPEDVQALFRVAQLALELKLADIESADTEFSKLRDKWDDSERRVRDLEKKLKSKDKDLASIPGNKTIADLIADVEELTTENSALHDQVEALKKGKEENAALKIQLEEELRSMQVQVDAAAKETERWQRDFNHLRNKYDSVMEKTSKTREASATAATALATSQSEVETLRKQVSDLERKRDDLSSQLAKNSDLKSKLESEFKEVIQLYEKQQLENEELQLRLEKLDALRKQQDRRITELNELLERSEEEVMHAVERYASEWKGMLERKQVDLSEREQRITALEEEKDSLRKKLHTLTRSTLNIGVVDDVSDIGSEGVDDAGFEVTRYRKRPSSSPPKVRGQGPASDSEAVSAMRAKLSEQEHRITYLQGKIDRVNTEIAQKDAAVSELTEKLRGYESGTYGMDQAQSEIRDMRRQVQYREADIARLTDSINVREKQIQALVDENSLLKEKFQRVTGEEVNDMDLRIEVSKLELSRQLKLEQLTALKIQYEEEISRLEDERVHWKNVLREIASKRGPDMDVDLKALLQDVVSSKHTPTSPTSVDIRLLQEENTRLQHQLESSVTEYVENVLITPEVAKGLGSPLAVELFGKLRRLVERRALDVKHTPAARSDSRDRMNDTGDMLANFSALNERYIKSLETIDMRDQEVVDLKLQVSRLTSQLEEAVQSVVPAIRVESSEEEPVSPVSPKVLSPKQPQHRHEAVLHARIDNRIHEMRRRYSAELDELRKQVEDLEQRVSGEDVAADQLQMISDEREKVENLLAGDPVDRDGALLKLEKDLVETRVHELTHKRRHEECAAVADLYKKQCSTLRADIIDFESYYIDALHYVEVDRLRLQERVDALEFDRSNSVASWRYEHVLRMNSALQAVVDAMHQEEKNVTAELRRVEEIESQMQTLRKQYEAQTFELEKLQNTSTPEQADGTVSELHRRVSELEARLQEQAFEADFSVKRAKEAESAIAALKKREQEQREKIVSVSAELVRAKQEIAQLTDSLGESLNPEEAAGLRSRAQKMEDDLFRMKGEREELVRLVDMYRRDESKETHAVDVLTTERDELLQQIADVRGGHASDLQERNARLHTEVAQLKTRLLEEVRKRSIQTLELKRAQSNRRQLELRIQQISRSKANGSSASNQTPVGNASVLSVLANLRESSRIHHTDSPALRKEYDGKLAAVERTIEELRNAMRSYESPDSDSAVSSMPVKYIGVTEKVAQLQIAELKLTRKLQECEAQLQFANSSRKDLEEYSLELEQRMVKQNAVAEASHLKIRSNLSTVEAQLQEVEAELLRCRRHANKTSGQTTVEHDDLIDELKSDLELARDRIRALEQEVMERDRENRNLSMKASAGAMHPSQPERGATAHTGNHPSLRTLQALLAQKEESIARYQRMLEDEREQYLAEKRLAQVELEKMQDRMFEENADALAKLRESLLNLDNENTPPVNSGAMKSMEDLDEIMYEKDQRLAVLATQLETATSASDGLKSQLHSANVKIEQLQREIEMYKNESVYRNLRRVQQQLKQQLQVKNKQLEQLQAAIASLKKEFQVMATGTADLEAQVHREQRSEEDRFDQRVKQETASLSSEIKRLHKELERSSKACDRAKQQHGQASANAADLTSKISELERDNANLKRKLRDKVREVTPMSRTSSVDALATTQDPESKKLEELEKRNRVLTATHKNDLKLRDKVAQLEAEKRALQISKANLERTLNSDVKEQIHNLIQGHDQAMSDMTAFYEKRLAELQGEVSGMQDSSKKVVEKPASPVASKRAEDVNEKRMVESRLRKQVDKLIDSKKKLASDLEAAEAARKETETKMNVLKEKYESLLASKKPTKKPNAQKLLDNLLPVARLQDKLDDANNENRRLKRVIEVEQGQLIRELKRQLESTDVSTRNTPSTLEEELFVKDNLIVELKFDLEEQKQLVETFEQKLRVYHAVSELLQKGAGASGPQSLPDEDTDLKVLADSLKRVVSKLQTENSNLKKNAVSNVKYMDAVKEAKGLRSKLEELQTAFNELKSRHDMNQSVTDKAGRLAEMNNQLQRQLKQERATMDGLQRKLKQGQDEAGELRSRIEELETAVADAEAKSTATNDPERKRLEMAVVTLEETVHSLRDELKAKTHEIRELEAVSRPMDRSVTPARIAELEGRIAGLQRERDELTARLAKYVHAALEKPGAGGGDAVPVTSPRERETTGASSKVQDEVRRLAEENQQLRAELDAFDPAFFEEIEDLKYNYEEAVRLNGVYEQELQKLRGR